MPITKAAQKRSYANFEGFKEKFSGVRPCRQIPGCRPSPAPRRSAKR